MQVLQLPALFIFQADEKKQAQAVFRNTACAKPF